MGDGMEIFAPVHVCSGVMAVRVCACLQEVAMGVATCGSVLCTLCDLGETQVCNCGFL